MTSSYHVHLDGPCTTITDGPDGPWPRWEMARLAVVEHMESQVRECLLTLMCSAAGGELLGVRAAQGGADHAR